MAGYSTRLCPACGKTSKFRNDYKTCCKKGGGTESTKPDLVEQNEIRGDAWNITLPKTRIHTLDQLLTYFEVDTDIWEVERFVANKWEMGYKDESTGKAAVEELYQVKAFLRRKKNVAFAKVEIEDLKRLAKTASSFPKPIKKSAKHKGGMLEINFTDHHFGKLSWGLETGWANYDVKIATQVFHRALDTTLDRSPFSYYDEIWFIVGNDLFNADDTQGRTTAGTQVESDVRHEKTYVTVRTLLIQAIEKLRHLTDKVRVIVVPGNHDHNATWHLGDSLEVYFTNYDDVDVDNQPSPRKYHRFGQTLIMYTHGDKGKRADLPLLMAAEKPSLFGATRFHEIHTGHTHQTRLEEKHGIRIRVLPALCPPDAWHAENGYVGNLRSSESFVWDREEGLIGTIIYTDSDGKIDRASETPSIVEAN